MQGEKGERWRKLCEKAAIEQNPQKLMELAEGLIACWKQKSSGLKRAANEYCLARADRQEMFSRESQRSVSLRLNALAGWPIRRNDFGIGGRSDLPVHPALKRHWRMLML